MKRQKSILIVDDETDLGEVLLDLLSPIYEEIVFLNSSAKAKELIETRSFSLIISDVHMPDLIGPELVRMARSFGRIDPIIFLTGKSTKELILTALRLGVVDVIDKPIDADEFLKSLDRIFDIERRRENFFENNLKKSASPEALQKQKRIIGLLQVANEKKKAV